MSSFGKPSLLSFDAGLAPSLARRRMRILRRRRQWWRHKVNDRIAARSPPLFQSGSCLGSGRSRRHPAVVQICSRFLADLLECRHQEPDGRPNKSGPFYTIELDSSYRPYSGSISRRRSAIQPSRPSRSRIFTQSFCLETNGKTSPLFAMPSARLWVEGPSRILTASPLTFTLRC